MFISATGILNVLPATKINELPREVSGQIGGNVTLNCTISNDTNFVGEIRWLKDGEDFGGSNIEIVSTGDKTRILTISNVGSSDTGKM